MWLMTLIIFAMLLIDVALGSWWAAAIIAPIFVGSAVMSFSARS
jgi:hypothetical protein